MNDTDVDEVEVDEPETFRLVPNRADRRAALFGNARRAGELGYRELRRRHAIGVQRFAVREQRRKDKAAAELRRRQEGEQ